MDDIVTIVAGPRFKLDDSLHYELSDGFRPKAAGHILWKPGAKDVEQRLKFLEPLTDEQKSQLQQNFVGVTFPAKTHIIGHYALPDKHTPKLHNVLCVDGGVKKTSGSIKGYRWDGERTLSPDKVTSVQRFDGLNQDASVILNLARKGVKALDVACC